MDDVERVARAIATADDKWKFTRWEDVPESIKPLFRADAAAAMREVRLIDAEALRGLCLGETVPPRQEREQIANWLQSRAGGNNDNG